MEFDSCVGSVNGVLVWSLDRLLSPGERSVDLWRYTAYPSMHAASGPPRSLPGLALVSFLFLFFFEGKRSSLHSRSLLSKVAFFSSVR